MIPKYRTQFELRDATGPASLERARGEVCAWLGSKESVSPGDLVKPGSHGIPGKCEIAVLHDIIGDEEQWALRYSRPDARDPVTWVVDVGLAQSERQLLASISMGVEVTAPRAYRLEWRLRPPSVVKWLAQRIGAHAGHSLSEQARVVQLGESVTLLTWVGAPTRPLPVVAVSVDQWTEKPLLDPNDLQRRVLGLAEVVLIGKRTGLRLREALASQVASRTEAETWLLHSGAVRIYWPGLNVQSKADSPYGHKLWIPEDGRLPRHVHDEIFETLSWTAIHRPYAHWTDLRTIERRADQESLARLSGRLSAEEKSTYDQALARLRRELDETRRQLEASVDEVRVARANAEQAWQQERETRIENANLRASLNDCVAEPSRTLKQTAEEAVEAAKAQYSQTLLFASDLTLETSESGEFWFGALTALHELCLREKGGQLERGHEQIEVELPELLGKNNCPRKRPKHEDTNVEKAVPGRDVRVHLRWRVHLKSGPRTQSESLYWEPIGAGDNRRYLVGWIGWHPED